MFRPFALALTMLTVLRVPVRGTATPGELRTSTAYYPLVGLLVGLGPALALLLPLPDAPRAVLALALWVLVTGALHVDGWADCCDAAFAPRRGTAEEMRARRLEILKDPRVGVFGVVGVVLLLLAKWSALLGAATGLLTAALLALAALLLPPAAWTAALGAVVAGATVGVLVAAFLIHRFGGVTGDVCGAAGEAAELAVLWALLAWTFA
jgi:adenosylcobinamide-GDP ribazoletransferase